ncbi:50S ribosomal protein L4 [Candidatus Collierbacteria bacterium]|nr:50S ribosomal protein L4 [Candidatus Collierbacteria bacterium]
MKMDIVDMNGKKSGVMEVAGGVFAVPMNPTLVAQAVYVANANLRQGAATALTRGETYGSRRKLYRQKGTGNARHGDKFAPQFVGGGISHGPLTEKNYRKSITLKMKRKAFCCVLSQKVRTNNLIVIEDLDKKKKTKEMAKMMIKISTGSKLLFLADEKHAWALRLLKNLPEIISGRAMNMDILSLMKTNTVIVTRDGVTELELRLKGVKGNK